MLVMHDSLRNIDENKIYERKKERKSTIFIVAVGA
jgi:hypothetical protein